MTTSSSAIPPFDSISLPDTSILNLIHKSEVFARENEFLVEYDPSNAAQFHDKSLDIKFFVCLAENLAKKPSTISAVQSSTATPKKKKKKRRNPFLGPFVVGSHVCDISDSEYRLILNKFPVLPHHFLAISKSFVPQTAPLIEGDFKVIANILASLKNENMLCFFNSGSESGATMVHRHLHFIPTEKNCNIMINEEVQKQQQKHNAFMLGKFGFFIHAIKTFDRQSSDSYPNGKLFFKIYQELWEFIEDNLKNSSGLDMTTVSLSFNLIITHDLMMVIPRKCGSYNCATANYSSNININGGSNCEMKFSVNSLPFCGFLFFNSVQHLSWFNNYQESEGMMNVFKNCTYPVSKSKDNYKSST